MFRVLSALLFFGTLSPVHIPGEAPSEVAMLGVSPPPVISSFSVGQSFSASGAIVIDALTGKEVYGLRADEPRAVGSLAKLMTAIVILEHHDLDELVTVPRGVREVVGSVAGLRPGDRHTVRDLLGAALVASANDAAYTLAVEHSDSTELFAEEMNSRARALGLTKTHFTNPIGYDNPGQVSTPRELAWLSMYALKNDVIRSFAGRRSITIADQSGEHEMTLFNTNRLLTSHPTHFFGLKTGTTDAAGQCLISLTYAEGRPYLLIVLKSADRYEDTLRLFELLSDAHA